MEKDLVDSHLIPRSILKLCREDSLPNPNPLTLTRKVMVRTSRQITTHLLCSACEDKFSKNGETWVGANVARMESFPIGEALLKTTPLISYKRVTAYAGAAVPEIDMEKLVYFGLSIFWRCSAHDWRDATGGRIQIELGPYEEPIRRFLLGEAPLPKTIALLIALPTGSVLIGTYTPRRGHEKDFHNFVFYVPGIEFTLSAGRKIPVEVRALCAHTSPQKIILFSGATTSNTAASFDLLRDVARPSLGVKKFINELAEMRNIHIPPGDKHKL